MIPDGLDVAELLKREQERSAQLETYASDLNRTYSELRRHLQHMTVLHEVNTRIASALDPDEVLAGMLDSLSQLLTLSDRGRSTCSISTSAVPAEGPHTVVPADDAAARARRARLRRGPARSRRGLGRRRGQHDRRSHARAAHGRPHDRRRARLQLVVPLRAGGRSLGALELRLGRAAARRGRQAGRAAGRGRGGRPAERAPVPGDAAAGDDRCADRPEQLSPLPRPAHPRSAARAAHGLPGRADHHGPGPLQAGQRSPRPSDGRSGAAPGRRAAAQAPAAHRRGRSARRRGVRRRSCPATAWPRWRSWPRSCAARSRSCRRCAAV